MCVCHNSYHAYFIFHRMVVKIQGTSTREIVRHLTSQEYSMGRLLSIPGCPNILKTLSHSYRNRAGPPYLSYLYLEWALYGTLDDLIRRLQEQGAA